MLATEKELGDKQKMKASLETKYLVHVNHMALNGPCATLRIQA